MASLTQRARRVTWLPVSCDATFFRSTVVHHDGCADTKATKSNVASSQLRREVLQINGYVRHDGCADTKGTKSGVASSQLRREVLQINGYATMASLTRRA